MMVPRPCPSGSRLLKTFLNLTIFLYILFSLPFFQIILSLAFEFALNINSVQSAMNDFTYDMLR